MECEFCKKSLSTLSNLNYHKKTNKTCQSIQARNNKEPIVSLLTSCEFCDKVFSFQTLNVHLKTCKQKKKDDDIKIFMEKKDQEIERLMEKKDQENKILSDKLIILSNRLIEMETTNKILSKYHEEIIKIANKNSK